MTSTLSLDETINELKAKGYVEDFQDLPTLSDDYVVDEVFYFDTTQPSSKQSILYAMHSTETGRKGFLVNLFGIYSKPVTNMQIRALERWENEGGKSVGAF